MNKKINIIAACIRSETINNGGIGVLKNNKYTLPWDYLKEDMSRFSKITTKRKDLNKENCVIMGYNTWESLPKRSKPLPDRLNVILSRKKNIQGEKIITYNSLETALDKLDKNTNIEKIFIIGGGTVYNQVINDTNYNKLYLTEIYKEYNGICDTFLPELPLCEKGGHLKKVKTESIETSQEPKTKMKFVTYKNMSDVNSDEQQYLDLVNELLKNKKETRQGRNGNTISLFGPQHIFDLRKGLPLLTTKKVYFKGIVEELLFFLRGSSDAKKLSAKGIRIWDQNTTKDFLASRGLNYKEGDMGPMYGFLWRNYGVKYEGCEKDYKNSGGYDQLWHLLNGLINDPYSRRHLLTTYDPSKVKESVLAPCHGLTVQFHVTNDNVLNCKMYQRSVDVMLGYPFNIASYGILVHIICKLTGYKPGNLIMTLGDVHIYEQHLDGAHEQIKRKPLKLPTLEINKEFNSTNDKKSDEYINDLINYIENLNLDDFELKNYVNHPAIKMKMVA